MGSLAYVLIAGVFGVCAGLLARRKGRSFTRWFVVAFFAPLPTVLLAALATPAGEPWRFRAPIILGILAAGLAGSLALLAVVAEVLK